jgi:Lrp/AsnC family leucine-responsive transcriptional regulator
MPKRLSDASAALPATAAGSTLDEVDRTLLRMLVEDGRAAVADLARQVGLSAPSTAERLRRLETQGVIERFTVQIDPRALGYTMQAIVRVRPLPGQLHLVEEAIRRIPEFVECDKVTGEDCFVCRLYLRSIEELDEILSKVTDRAETNTAIIKSTPIKRRLPPLGIPATAALRAPKRAAR